MQFDTKGPKSIERDSGSAAVVRKEEREGCKKGAKCVIKIYDVNSSFSKEF